MAVARPITFTFLIRNCRYQINAILPNNISSVRITYTLADVSTSKEEVRERGSSCGHSGAFAWLLAYCFRIVLSKISGNETMITLLFKGLEWHHCMPCNCTLVGYERELCHTCMCFLGGLGGRGCIRPHVCSRGRICPREVLGAHSLYYHCFLLPFLSANGLLVLPAWSVLSISWPWHGTDVCISAYVIVFTKVNTYF